MINISILNIDKKKTNLGNDENDEFEKILLQSYKDDVREAGLAEGLEKGRAEGHKEGQAEGRTIGMKEKEEEIINKLKKKGFSEAEINELLK